MSKRASVHSFAALLGALLVGVFTIQSGGILGGSVQQQDIIDIGVEHTQSLGVGLSVSTLGGKSIIEFENQGNETIFVSMPQRWTKREVRNVPLEDVRADASSFGFNRWHLPAGAQIELWSNKEEERFLVHNPSGIPLKVLFTQVDLQTEQTLSDVILIQDSSVELSATAL